MKTQQNDPSTLLKNNSKQGAGLRFASIDWVKGLIRGRRFKTGQLFEFGTVPPVLELLKQRRERCGKNEYVFPELIFSDTQLQ